MSLAEFIHMGGYGVYVWSAYGIGLVVLVANVVLPLRRRKQVMRDLARKLRRENTS